LRLIYQDTYETLKDIIDPKYSHEDILDLFEATDRSGEFRMPNSGGRHLSRWLATLNGHLLGKDFRLAASIPDMLNWVKAYFDRPPDGEMRPDSVYCLDLSQTESIFADLAAFRLGTTKSIISSRKLAILDTDILTLAPLETRAGDLIAIMPQYMYPIVLRSIQHDQNLAVSCEVAAQLELSKRLWHIPKHPSYARRAMMFLFDSKNTEIERCDPTGECFAQGTTPEAQNRPKRLSEDIECEDVELIDYELPPFQPMSFALH